MNPLALPLGKFLGEIIDVEWHDGVFAKCIKSFSANNNEQIFEQ